jgi:hypothetical protein
VHCVIELRRYRRWDLDAAALGGAKVAFAFAPASYGTIVLNLRDEASAASREEAGRPGKILEARPLGPMRREINKYLCRY